MHKCLLCNTTDKLLDFFKDEKGVQFLKCGSCGFIFKTPEHHLNAAEEEVRYKLHQNDILDSGYQNYLRPVVEAVLSSQNPDDRGLDYGCGPASVIVHLLNEHGYSPAVYDPLFFPDVQLLSNSYDYITCTEVIEHFTQPRTEFLRLHDLLRPAEPSGGRLYVKTSLTDSIVDFQRWHYRRDLTHVGFYCRQSLEYIRSEFGFVELRIEDQYFVLSV